MTMFDVASVKGNLKLEYLHLASKKCEFALLSWQPRWREHEAVYGAAQPARNEAGYSRGFLTLTTRGAVTLLMLILT